MINLLKNRYKSLKKYIGPFRFDSLIPENIFNMFQMSALEKSWKFWFDKK